MTNFYVTYTFENRAAREAFYAEICEKKIAEISRAEEGCIRYAYYYPADADDQILLWEQWESREAQKAHCTQPHFAEIGKLKEKYHIETEILVEDH